MFKISITGFQCTTLLCLATRVRPVASFREVLVCKLQRKSSLTCSAEQQKSSLTCGAEQRRSPSPAAQSSRRVPSPAAQSRQEFPHLQRRAAQEFPHLHSDCVNHLLHMTPSNESMRSSVRRTRRTRHWIRMANPPMPVTLIQVSRQLTTKM
jgi:hypothetical protein